MGTPLILDWNVDLYCHGLVDVEYNVTRMWNESIGLGHRICNSGPHALEWNVDCSKMPCENNQGFIQDSTL